MKYIEIKMMRFRWSRVEICLKNNLKFRILDDIKA